MAIQKVLINSSKTLAKTQNLAKCYIAQLVSGATKNGSEAVELMYPFFYIIERLDEKFAKLRDNEVKLERWVRFIFYYLHNDFC